MDYFSYGLLGEQLIVGWDAAGSADPAGLTD
jgi:hypothetical protein